MTRLYPTHIPTNSFQKVLLAIGSGIGAIQNLYRDDLVATFGEVTGKHNLKILHDKMMSTPEGARILLDQPRISEDVINFNKLKSYPATSLGAEYYRFCTINKITPDSRKPVHFVDDAELAFVVQRIREIHDFHHLLLNMPTTKLGEISVKWYEGLALGLPSGYFGGLFGPLRLSAKQRQLFITEYFPYVIRQAKNCRFPLGMYFEKHLEEPIVTIREKLNIEPFS